MITVLFVGGHDPTAGAGIDADRETAAAFGVEARCVVTARTDQDGVRVRSLGAREPDEWLAEARAAGTGIAALKTGLLPGPRHVRACARLVAELGIPTVVDPVLAASGGEVFLDDEGVRALLEELVPHGVVLTPNLPELARLAGLSAGEGAILAADPEARTAAARELLDRGAAAVVAKGGHGAEDPVRDLVLAAGAEPVWLEHARVPGASLHGSGCRFASALAAGLARGESLPQATRAAGNHVAGLLSG
ncbi:MAG: hydroxymethylpyrimidine/phosphomethylpyrimidine kinase [Planctomycetota bacterium]|nr:hydroxymethylpyrimidine/phosphomethylpyrimidine kinase [Planctomycetota bacterium]